jgi:hypothetical protein
VVLVSQILLDGINVKELNVAWLREQFGLVSQEPDLFADTLEYNILYGKPDAVIEPCDPRNPPKTAKSSTGDVVCALSSCVRACVRACVREQATE